MIKQPLTPWEPPHLALGQRHLPCSTQLFRFGGQARSAEATAAITLGVGTPWWHPLRRHGCFGDVEGQRSHKERHHMP